MAAAGLPRQGLAPLAELGEPQALGERALHPNSVSST